MAEGRRLATEKRQQESEARLAEEKRLEDEQEMLRLEPATIQEFRKMSVQIKTFSNEIRILSKKSPDAPVNKFKLKFLNHVLKKTTSILGEAHRPFLDFETFDDGDLPTTSDVLLMLSHYAESMNRFFAHHTYKDKVDRVQKWHTKGDEDIKA